MPDQSGLIQSPVTAPPEAPAADEAACPGCSIPVTAAIDQKSRCSYCGWQGELLVFHPPQLVIDAGQAALPDDATCVHHPTKRADAICAGTGDYICALCSIEQNGQTYSAAFLSTAGGAKVTAAFDRTLERPDSAVIFYMALCFVPYVNVVWLFGWPIWVVLGWVKLAKARRLRREDSLFARLVSPARLVGIGVIFAIFNVLLLGLTVFVVAELAGVWTTTE